LSCTWGDTRLKSVPDISTAKELGIDAENYQMIGLTIPMKTPMSVVEKLRGIPKKVTEDKKFINIVETQGDEERFTSGDRWTSFWESESEVVSKIYKQLLSEKK